MKVKIIVVAATAAMCVVALQFVMGMISTSTFHWLLVLIVVAGSTSVFGRKQKGPKAVETPPAECNRSRAAAAGE